MEIAYNEKIFPLKGILSDSMSDKEFYDFCQQNELFHIERDENRQIIIMPPTNANSGIRNTNLLIELGNWNRRKIWAFALILQLVLLYLTVQSVHQM